MLAMAAISNTSPSPMRPSSPGPAFTASPNSRANRSQATSARCPYPAPGVPGIPPTSPGPAWIASRSKTGRPARAWRGRSTTIAERCPSSLAPTRNSTGVRSCRASRASLFVPDGNLNAREIPIALQLPDWNHWLPQVHPMDAWGPAFQKMNSPNGTRLPPTLPARLARLPESCGIDLVRPPRHYFDKWRDARHAFLKPYVEGKSVNWTPELAVKAYSTQLWQLVKTWEMTQEFGLEARGREMFGPDGEPRTWLNTIPGGRRSRHRQHSRRPVGNGRQRPDQRVLRRLLVCHCR